MKKILLTGSNSYVGTSFERYMAKWPEEYEVDTVDMTDGTWRMRAFSGYNAIFHVAGIAHQDNGKISEDKRSVYFQVNTNLAIETAVKAKNEGANQFVFMSTMSVYGEVGIFGRSVAITQHTKPSPKNAYGESKLRAEEGILHLSDDSFHVCILRPPMIYGPGCKGNYPMLAKAALTLPLFPDVENERSMLFIERLCAFVKAVVDSDLSGIHFPQNAEYVCTSDLVVRIARAHGKKIRLTRAFNPVLRMLSGKVGVVDKVFGGLVYDKLLTGTVIPDEKFSFEESISITENEFSA